MHVQFVLYIQIIIQMATTIDTAMSTIPDNNASSTSASTMAMIPDNNASSRLSLDDTACDVGSLTLISNDGVSFTLDRKNACLSNLVKTSLESDPFATELPMPGVKGVVLKRVVVYLNHRKGIAAAPIEKPLRSKLMKDVCKDAEDAAFIDGIGEHNRQDLYDLILAANYMDIKCLLILGCAKVASLIKGQPLEKIKEILAKGTSKEVKPNAPTDTNNNTASSAPVESKDSDEKKSN